MDHTSITKFIEWRFGLKAMSPRDAAAINPAATAFDFRRPRFDVPNLPVPQIDPVTLATSLAGLAAGPNPVPELTEAALARAPRELLQLRETGVRISTFDRATGLVGELGRMLRS